MKKLIIIFVVFLTCNGFAQHTELPMKSHEDFEMSKPIKYMKLATYQADENGWEPLMAEVISFNESDQLIQKYTRIMGEYASETAYNYVYTDTYLDSLNILATASNFNVKTDYITDSKGRIVSESAKGFYVDYTRVYEYNKDGSVKSITTNHTSGNHNWTEFNYTKGVLDFVTQVDGLTYDGAVKDYYLYNNGSLFASWNDRDNDLLLSPSDLRHYQLKNHSNPIVAAKELRKLFNADKEAYDMQLIEISKEAEYVQEQAISFNENKDWTMKMVKSINFGQEQKRFVFREIVYQDGTTSGSTDFDQFFFQRMKDL